MTKASYDGKVVKDSLGRSITLRKPNIMDRYYLNKAMKQDAEIPACVNMMFAILFVAKIDDRVFESPRSYEECMELLQYLKDEGLLVVHENIASEIAEEPENVKK